MFKDILRTIGARYLVAFLNLLLIFINSKVLGREGMGVIGILFASANLIAIFNSFFCGNTIVYFINRYNLRYVFFPAYGWAFAGSAVVCFIMGLFQLLPVGYETTVFCLSVLISLVSAHAMMLLGKDRVSAFNSLFILQGVFLFVSLLGLYYIFGFKEVDGYLTGLFGAYIVAYLFSMLLLIPYLNKKKNNVVNKSFFTVLKEMFLYGLWSSIDNLAEGLTTRLNYFLVQHSGGYGQVGLLDSGTKIAESVWHLSNSVSYIEYNRVSKTTDLQEQKRITLQLFKLTCCALLIVMVLVCFVPEWVFTEYLLTAEFAGIRKVIIGMSLGIVALGSNRILSHFFIGSGRIKYSACCSLFGLALLFVAGLILVPMYGVLGAAMTASFAYAGMLVFSLIVFMKNTGTKPIEFIPSKSDFHLIHKAGLSLVRSFHIWK